MEFESLKLSEINEYGTIAGSNPVLTTIRNKMNITLDTENQFLKKNNQKIMEMEYKLSSLSKENQSLLEQ